MSEESEDENDKGKTTDSVGSTPKETSKSKPTRKRKQSVGPSSSSSTSAAIGAAASNVSTAEKSQDTLADSVQGEEGDGVEIDSSKRTMENVVHLPNSERCCVM